jgi:hypothetical protein
MAMMKAATNRAMISGIFQRRSLLGVAPQFQQAGSWLGTILPQAAQGRRDASVSRPHDAQFLSAAADPQKGHVRATAPAIAPAPCGAADVFHRAPAGACPGVGTVISAFPNPATLYHVLTGAAAETV